MTLDPLSVTVLLSMYQCRSFHARWNAKDHRQSSLPSLRIVSNKLKIDLTYILSSKNGIGSINLRVLGMCCFLTDVVTVSIYFVLYRVTCNSHACCSNRIIKAIKFNKQIEKRNQKVVRRSCTEVENRSIDPVGCCCYYFYAWRCKSTIRS